MLSTYITSSDVLFVMFMIINGLSMYAGYRWGKDDGRHEALKAMRLEARRVRRLTQ